MFWGFSPALNLFKELQIPNDVPELNILLLGSCDPRHILKTISESYKHPNVKINFYVCEKIMEQVARQLLLLNIAFESQDKLGLYEKTNIFMELFGNTLIRPSAWKYLCEKSQQLVGAVTDFSFAEKKMPMFKFDQLKFKERDYLENIFKFWPKSVALFDVIEAWDRRLRKYLGVRYDTRTAAFDWDYFMRLSEIGGDKIFSREYINWRLTGIAFSWIETDATISNTTFAAGILTNGDKMYHYGYLGDIVISPYICYGIECADESVWIKENGQYKKRATDITEINLTEIFHQIATKSPFSSSKPRIGGDHGRAYIANSDTKSDLYDGCINETVDIVNSKPLIPSDHSIVFLSPAMLPRIHLKNNFKNFFDLIYFSSEMIQYLNSDLLQVTKASVKIIVESKKFQIHLTKDEIKAFTYELEKAAQDSNCEFIEDFDSMKHCYARMERKS